MSDAETIDGEVVEDLLPERREEAGAVNLFGDASPADVIAKAHAAAVPLARVIDEQKLYKNIQGKKHVLVEGWTLLGSMLGVFPVVEWTRAIGTTQAESGWEARVVAKTLEGREVGSAEAMCTRQETRWAKADDYAIRSMAQTRATSKALRLPLGFVMTLAGYEATPSEEMPADTSAAPSGNHLTDPANFLPPGFPAGRDLDKRIGKMLSAVDPQVDWRATWDESLTLLGTPRKELDSDGQRQAWTRLANVAERLSVHVDAFPPPTDEDIAGAFAACFEGVTPTVVRHEPAEEGEGAR